MKNNQKTKIIQTKIRLQPTKQDYTVQTRKRCKWCWLLLLLLLPLLLLIPLKKDVTLKLIDTYNNEAVANIPVNFEYRKRAVFDFDSLRFFTNFYPVPGQPMVETTNAAGLVTFKDVKYTVYQWASFYLHKTDIARAYVLNNCVGADSTYQFFKLKPNQQHDLYLSALLYDMEFTVVDADDNNEPLPGALVRIKTDTYNITASDTADNSGRVVFRKIPKCAEIEVIGSKYGWYNDTIKGKADNIYLKDDTLFLRQEKVIVKFFVRDLNTEKPLVNAHGQLFFQDNPTQQIGSDAITNINGVAKGVFENIHKIKKIRIDVNKNRELIYYQDTSTVDYLNYISVEAWQQRSDQDKIIYIRPNPKPILFQDIDCKTNRGLSGVKNKVTIKKADGTVIGPTDIISDASGNFSISAGMGDKITIEARSDRPCPNEYLPNNNTIVEALYDDLKDNAQKRKIPLCPKDPPTVRFRDVDAATGRGIAGVTNTVSISGGRSFTKISDANGWFEISEVFECQIISIKANGSSVGYGQNDSKIRNKRYQELMPPVPQSERDIPLQETPKPIRVQFCDVNESNTVISGAQNEIYVNGRKVATKPGGCFYVEALPDDKIKIVGKFRGLVNSNKVDGSKTLEQLKNMPQSARNIPFEDNVLGCEGSDSGSNRSIERIHDLNGCDNFTITWDLGGRYPDNITIYCGTGAAKRQIFSTGMVTGTGTRTLTCSKKRILITVEANTDSGTNWSYDLKCNCN